MAIHIVLVVLLLFATAFRRRVPFGLRAGFLLFFFVAIGIAGLLNFGLLSGAVAFLLIAPILAAALLSLRVALVLMAFSVVASGMIGFAIVRGDLVIPLDAEAYVVSPSAWMLRLVGWLLTSGSMTLAVGILMRMLLEAVRRAERHATALEQSEAQHRRLIHNLPEIIYTWGAEAGYQYCSPQIEEALGISPEDLRAEPDLWAGNIHSEDREIVQRARTALGANEPFDIIYRIHDKEGACHWFHDRSTAIRREGKGVVVDALVTDITAQREAEEKLRQSQKMEAIGQLTGGIAHDFNNLLSIMMLNSEYLESVVGSQNAARPRLDMIKQAVGKASALTNRLLAFSRRQVLQAAPTDIAALITDLEELLRRTLGEAVELTVGHSPNLWAVKVDRYQLDNALINLAINARDAMHEGGNLTIHAANFPVDPGLLNSNPEIEPGDYVRISVSDTGGGMPDEIVAHIFEPFFTTKDVGEGSGLGLSMVYGFVTQSEGYVTVDSQVGRGTTFNLYLPRSLESVVTLEDAGGTAVSDTLASERILVVEDDEDVRAVPVIILRSQGYEVVEAANGEQAILRFDESGPFDLLFTDMVMPGGMSGVELAQKARERQPGLKVLFTSGYAEDFSLQDRPRPSQTAILNKPYRRADLLERVRSALKST